ncbi:hypothetical protein ABZ016_00230 [Streptomyces sp. NPDC006372]|uniref:hypothetical protein n=1 Tax=Streptomyces sp. NPDC006372 TaxID=3155599 RepID=UPI0033A32DB3
MHIPSYAHATIRTALPAVPTSRQVGGLACCLCAGLFGKELAPVPLGPGMTSGPYGCRPCLTRLVARARRTRDAARVQDAERAQAEAVAWARTRERYVAGVERVREAAEAVARLAGDEDIEPLRIAWLLVSLESAHAWATDDKPEPPAAIDADSALREAEFRLLLEMTSARETVADRLAYHVINQAAPEEPEVCAELECPEDCSGRHDTEHIDCGPDAVFEDLAEYGVVVERAAPAHAYDGEQAPSATPERQALDMSELLGVLAHFGIDPDDTETLVSVAAVGLVADAWRNGPLDEIHVAAGGPSDGEVFAQSVDLYRRARAALVAARENGPEALLAFQAVAADVDLPWAGGSRFTLRASGEPTAEFSRHVDDRVWFTAKVMREQGWRAALLHRAAPAVFRDPGHFGMPGWPAAVASAMERLTALDRSDAPDALGDLAAVEAALLEAPDRLGTAALDWIAARSLFG